MSWYQTGVDGVDKEQERLDRQQGIGRLWIKPGTSKQVFFVDDEPFCIYEHNPKLNGSYRNQFTCLQGANDEVTCCQILGPTSRYYVGYLTTVDCSVWEDAKGAKHQYEMRLVGLKLKSLKKFRRKKEDKGSLVSTVFKLTRDDDKSPTCGDDWEYERTGDPEKLFSVTLLRGKKLTDLWAEAEASPEALKRLQAWVKVTPDSNGKLPRVVPSLNYLEVLKPQSPKELRIALAGAEKDGDSPRGRTGATEPRTVVGKFTDDEDDIPF
jgi:hypothetical protein